MHTEVDLYRNYSIIVIMEKKLLTKKQKLSALFSYSDFIRIDDAEKILGLSRVQTSKTLSNWARQGWLKRVAAGVYIPVPLGMSDDEQVLNDPWIAIPELFPVYYIGGLSAAHHWELTEQTFRNTFVFTTKTVRSKVFLIQGQKFITKTIKKQKMFGTERIWREHKKIFISDIHKTLIDMLDDPLVGGGIQHVSYCFDTFIELRQRKHRLLQIRDETKNRKLLGDDDLRESSLNKDFKKLIDYSKKMGNGNIFKRLGFLAEQNPQSMELAIECKKYLTKGYAKLDPSIKCDKLITKWRLWIPSFWEKESL